MKKNLLYIVFVCSSSFVFGQINIQDDLSLTTLVENLQGTGVEISNITYDCEIGSNNPFGRYVDSSSTTGLTEGLILTTGSARNAVGPNKNAGKGDQNSYDEKFDSDLSSLVTSGNGAFYDMCIVEFDISIYSNELSFKYVFGSEEYPEFVGSYHDLFGFFISGPGIVGAQNLALIPFSNDPVSVSTVNSNTNVNWYNSNGDGMIPPYSEIMQYDGYTDVLTAKLEVAPCETYHIKIIIADEGDGIYDSGIFLEAGSFSSTEERIETSFEYDKYDYAIEGCNKGYFTFSRIGLELNQIDQPVLLKYLIEGNAINGTDYDTILDSIIIPAFQNSVTLEINPLIDTITDPNETLTISIINDCPALPPTFSATILINEFFEHTIPSTYVCYGESIQLNIPSNTSKYNILWDNNIELSCFECHSPFSTPDSSASYGYTLTDPVTGCFSKDDIDVTVLPLPIALFDMQNNDNYTNLDLFFFNNSSFANQYSWDFGDNTSSSLVNPVHSYEPDGNSNETSYEITLWAINSATGCKSSYSRIYTILKPFYLPNIFTPNNDSDNDAFIITGIESDIWSLRVYNRWGKTVYKTNKYNNRWEAENIPDGVYYFDLMNPNEDKSYKGWLQIIR